MRFAFPPYLIILLMLTVLSVPAEVIWRYRITQAQAPGRRASHCVYTEGRPASQIRNTESTAPGPGQLCR